MQQRGCTTYTVVGLSSVVTTYFVVCAWEKWKTGNRICEQVHKPSSASLKILFVVLSYLIFNPFSLIMEELRKALCISAESHNTSSKTVHDFPLNCMLPITKSTKKSISFHGCTSGQ